MNPASRHPIVRSVLIVLAGVFVLTLVAVIPGRAVLTAFYNSQKAATLLAPQTGTATATKSANGQAATGQTVTGNGAPSGPHYDLNIHGIQTGGSASTGSSGHDIFVPLKGRCNIALSPGSFQVLDPNCLDGNAAFQLPNPVGVTTSTTVTTVYSVWVRALAKPGGSSSTTTCAVDLAGTLVCSTAQFVIVETRKNGQSVFTNVTADLLFVSQCIGGTLTRTPIFDSSLQNSFWQYDNNGLKLLQLRFYQVATTVAAGGTTC